MPLEMVKIYSLGGGFGCCWLYNIIHIRPSGYINTSYMTKILRKSMSKKRRTRKIIKVIHNNVRLCGCIVVDISSLPGAILASS